MRYGAREEYIKYQLFSKMSKRVIPCKRAEKADEDFFNYLCGIKRQEIERRYLESGTAEKRFAQKLESYERKIAEARDKGTKMVCQRLKEIFIEHKEEILRKERKYDFSLDEAILFAKVKYETLFDCCKTYIPTEILQEIKDLRVFCLGYTSKAVKQLLVDFAQKQKRKWENLCTIGESISIKAEEKLCARLRVRDFRGVTICKIEEKKYSVKLWIEKNNKIQKLRIIKGKFLEGQEEIEFLKEEKHSIITSEIYYEDKKYELHFLMHKANYKTGTKKCYCLTLRGKHVRGM
ncbi:MAG: hypothetical protein IJ996_06150 [Clostridia bacterium]|nr:hypothetical protein [Clostridia bacterium]